MFEQPAQILDFWLEKLNAGEFVRVAGLYNQRAVLLPTFAGESLRSSEAIQAYFERLRGYRNVTVFLHPDSVVIQRLSEFIHCLGGMYYWQFEDEDQSRLIEARFTFVVDLRLDAPILHHHSSRVPQVL